MLAGVKVWINAEHSSAEQAAQRQNQAEQTRFTQRQNGLHRQFYEYRGSRRADVEAASGVKSVEADEMLERFARNYAINAHGSLRVVRIDDGDDAVVFLIFLMDRLDRVSVEVKRAPWTVSQWREIWNWTELLRELATFLLSVVVWAVPLMLLTDAIYRRNGGHVMIASGIVVILAVQLGDELRAGIYMALSGICQILVGGAFVWWPANWLARRRRKPVEPLCEKCGYNLTGNISGRCPECGTFIPPQLRRRIGLVEPAN
jgi:hypothetical protein